MSSATLRKLLIAFLVLLVPIAWLAMTFDPYNIDGDAVAYMDIAGYIRAHQWAAVVNAYWHPLYPACLALAQVIFHPTRFNELAAYYKLNYAIFALEVVAMLAFATALAKLRERMLPSTDQSPEQPLLSLNALRFAGLALLLIAVQRELSMSKVRPDALLQALMLGAFAAILATLALDTLWLAPVAGILFGLAYLTKSFALAVAMLSILVLLVSGIWMRGKSFAWAAKVALLTVIPFAAIAGPYIAALSHQKHRLDFGDSGSLNFAWYSADVDKMHLEPWMTDRFGNADVHLVHPEQQLLASPGIYSYKAQPYGTYPVWFDDTYFNERITPHIKLSLLLKRDARNVALVIRYLFNHPEGWALLLLLLVAGAKLRTGKLRSEGFWIPMVLLGLAMWCIYGLVNIEERYVTLAYLVVVLPVFAMLRSPSGEKTLRRAASAMVVLLAFLALGESLRIALETRRQNVGHPLWYSPQMFHTAEGLAKLGIKPGDQVACLGTTACLYDHYWARLAGVTIPTEIYNPDGDHLLEAWEDLPNRPQVLDVLRGQGAKVLVAQFNPNERATHTAAEMGWVQLDETSFYALPLNIPAPAPERIPAKPWGIVANEGKP